MICGNSTGECVPKPEEPSVDEQQSKTRFTDISSNTVVRACQLDPAKESLSSPCGSNATACKSSDDQTVCCMYTNGVCCGKEGLCCPNGYTCDPVNEACQLNDEEPTRLEETPSGRACANGSTKCQAGCCPGENAVCCSDGLNW